MLARNECTMLLLLLVVRLLLLVVMLLLLMMLMVLLLMVMGYPILTHVHWAPPPAHGQAPVVRYIT
jgi:hypothetical protein